MLRRPLVSKKLKRMTVDRMTLELMNNPHHIVKNHQYRLLLKKMELSICIFKRRCNTTREEI